MCNGLQITNQYTNNEQGAFEAHKLMRWIQLILLLFCFREITRKLTVINILAYNSELISIRLFCDMFVLWHMMQYNLI